MTKRVAVIGGGLSGLTAAFFLLREAESEHSQRLILEDGSLLLFDGTVRHALPKTRRAVGERINLTFRVLT